MAKLIEYDQVETLKDEDIFLIDGERGTKTISAKNLANDIKKVSLDELTEYTDDKFSKLDDAKLDKTGDASDVTSDIQSATIRTNLTTGEKLAVSLGKIKKFFSDLKTVAFTGSYADLTEKPTSMTANGGNADTVNNHTVDTDVPEDAKFTDTVYVHPETSGNKHIPSGGSSGQILRWSADGTAVWGADSDTTYDAFVKSGTKAKAGLVPSPPITAGTTKYLREDGTWAVPSSSIPDDAVTGIKGNAETEYRTGKVNLTPENIGALPISGGKLTGQLQVGEKVKLYTSSEGGNIQIISPDDIGLRWELDAFKGDLRFICFNNDGTVKKICQLTKDGTLIANNATQSAAGLMSPKDKEKLDNLSIVNNNTTTEAGYALDARQANPNVNGSLAKQISTLNSSLVKYLPLSGGTMTGTIIGQHKLPGSTASDANGMVLGVQTSGNTGIFNGNGDGNGADVANLIIKSWYGVGFVDGCSNQGMTVGIDCRSGNITCNSITIRNVGSVTDLLNSKLSTSASCNKNWNWSGKNETPAWIWGGSDGTNMYVYNPTYILVQGIRNRVTNRAMTITNDNHVRTYESNGVGMNGVISLGSGNYRFSQLYVTSSSISTSDKNYKDDIKSLTDKHLQFFMKLQPVSFLFKDGTSGRTHVGFIAQDVEQAMSECGLTDLDFAGFCKDQKVDSKLVDGEEVNEPILDDNGNPEYIYSLRYEEFIALNTYAIQKLWNHVETLEKENIETKNQIKSMQQDIAELKKSRA